MEGEPLQWTSVLLQAVQERTTKILQLQTLLELRCKLTLKMEALLMLT